MHTKPWNEDLLEWLAADFVSSGYDLKKLIRTIATSKTYQAQTAPTPTGTDAEPDRYVFRGPIARRLSAEQFIDGIWTITGGAPSTTNTTVIRMKIDPEKIGDTFL